MASGKLASAAQAAVVVGTVVICVLGIWREYRVVSSPVPEPAALRSVEGKLASCVPETGGLFGQSRLARGGWGGAPTYMLTLEGQPGIYRTHAFDCGVTATAAEPAAPAYASRVQFLTTAAGPGMGPDAPVANAYGLNVGGIQLRAWQQDLAEHRRWHDMVGWLHIAALVLAALVLPGLLVAAVRRRLWHDDETLQAEPMHVMQRERQHR